MATVGIDQFRTLDLRVATILDAEPHPRADRLVVMRVDLGDEQRQIVAGIREHYNVEALRGKQIVIVANLTPVSLRGVESQGMLLAATGPDGGLSLVIPERPIASGSPVR
jgi:methionine--tRNA ligase beta chain